MDLECSIKRKMEMVLLLVLGSLLGLVEGLRLILKWMGLVMVLRLGLVLGL